MEHLLCTPKNSTSQVEFNLHILQEPVQCSDFPPYQISYSTYHNSRLIITYAIISCTHHFLRQLEIPEVMDYFIPHSSS